MRVFCSSCTCSCVFLLLLYEEQRRASSAQKDESKIKNGMTSCFVEVIPLFNNKQKIAVNYSSHSDFLFSYSIFIILFHPEMLQRSADSILFIFRTLRNMRILFVRVIIILTFYDTALAFDL